MLKTTVRMLLLAAAVYVVFFVPLGERTLYQHFSRIAATDEAKDLGGEVGGVVDKAGTAAREKVLEPVSELVERARD